MLAALARLSRQRSPWLLLAATALGLEMTALYFQYGMRLEPCVLCVYQRVAIFGLVIAGIIGALAPAVAAVRWLAMASWALAAGWGLKIAIEHVDLQLDPSPFKQCAFLADFPNWMKLDQWLPAVFEPRGDCTQTVWDFMGYSMPQWMIVVFALYLVALLPVLIANLRR